MIGFLAGYVHFGRTPSYLVGGRAFVANAWPHLSQIWDDSTACLEAVRALVEAPGPSPRFVGVHLSAYKTTPSALSRGAGHNMGNRIQGQARSSGARFLAHGLARRGVEDPHDVVELARGHDRHVDLLGSEGTASNEH